MPNSLKKKILLSCLSDIRGGGSGSGEPMGLPVLRDVSCAAALRRRCVPWPDSRDPASGPRDADGAREAKPEEIQDEAAAHLHQQEAERAEAIVAPPGEGRGNESGLATPECVVTNLLFCDYMK